MQFSFAFQVPWDSKGCRSMYHLWWDPVMPLRCHVTTTSRAHLYTWYNGTLRESNFIVTSQKRYRPTVSSTWMTFILMWVNDFVWTSSNKTHTPGDGITKYREKKFALLTTPSSFASFIRLQMFSNTIPLHPDVSFVQVNSKRMYTKRSPGKYPLRT